MNMKKYFKNPMYWIKLILSILVIFGVQYLVSNIDPIDINVEPYYLELILDMLIIPIIWNSNNNKHE